MTITLRTTKGSELTYAELDGNFTHLNNQLGNLPDSGQVSATILNTVDSAYVQARENWLAVDNDIIPAVDSQYSLGSPTHKWKDLYLSGNTLHLGDLIMTVDSIGLQMNQAVNAEIRMTGNLDLRDGIITSTTGDIQILPKTAFPFGNNKTQFLHVAGDAGFMPNFTLHGTDVFFGDSPGFAYPGDLNNIYMHVGRIQTNGFPLSNNNAFKAAIVYHEDSAKFKFKDSDGWFELKKDNLDTSDVTTLIDSSYVQARQNTNYISLATLKTEVAASVDFADFKSRIAAL